jgi:hypothetical protein
MSDDFVVFLVYAACYGSILGYAVYLHRRLRKTED